MDIKHLDESNFSRWDAFVDGMPQASFFHRAGWKRVIEAAFGHRPYYLYAQSDGQICGVLPLVCLRSLLFGKALISTPFCVYGGVVARDSSIASALLETACELAEQLRVDYLETRNMRSCQEGWETKDLYVTFRKPIDPDPAQNLAAIPRKQRAMIRKGEKAGLQAAVDDNIARFYPAYSASVHNLGTPVFSKRYFELLCDEFAGETEVLTITQGGRTVSSVLSFYFRDEVLPYYGGGTAEARDIKANDYMYWELMRRASERGVRVFDYGRSKVNTGSYRFKKHWGFTPQPLHYEYYLVRAKRVPDMSPANPKYRVFIEAWKKLPMPVTRILGPMLVRNLG
ncbi:MAG: FemAB family XrtA/PEP-CTERM system-associated protein [Gammaproteobacteria bacterium]